MDFKKEAKGTLMPALRQHQHNDCSGLIMAYDYEATLDIVAGILEQHQKTCSHETIVTLLHDKAENLEKQGLTQGKIGNTHDMHGKMDTARCFRITANNLSGDQAG